MIATGEAIPLRGLEGVPGLPGAPQDEAGLTRKFETSHVGRLAAVRRVPLGQVDLLQFHELLKRGRWKEACAQLQQALAPGELWRPGLERDLSRGTVEFVLCGLIQP